MKAQLHSEVEELIKRAESESGQGQQDINSPVELQRRETRVEKIVAVNTEQERRAAERFAQEQTDYAANPKAREEKEQKRSRKLGGKAPKAPEAPRAPDWVAAMTHRMKTEAGKKFYAQRQSTVEPVFGIVKEAMGFRRFMLRGLDAVQGDWTLVCMRFQSKAPLCLEFDVREN